MSRDLVTGQTAEESQSFAAEVHLSRAEHMATGVAYWFLPVRKATH